jgi:hypothetical protein
MRHRIFSGSIIALIIFPFSAATPGVLPSRAASPHNSLLTETIRMTYCSPREAVKTLRQDLLDPTVVQPKSGVPAGIVRISYNNAEKSITVQGSAAAISDLKAMLFLLDVKPTYLEVKLRLIEIRLGEDGRRKETPLQASTLTAGNNRSVGVKILPAVKDSMSLDIMPRLNGD